MDEPSRLQLAAYGLGHVLNDACAILWFSYGLFFLHELCDVEPATSGLVIFAGQLADAIATPLAGVVSDCTPVSVPGGKRLVWITAGTVCVVVCFPRFFSPVVAATPVWSGFFASAFNVGWAATQVSHLALAPDLGGSEDTQLLLSTIRQVATVLSSLCSFVLVQVSLKALKSPPSAAASAHAFHRVADMVVTGGAVTSVLCVAFVKVKATRWPCAHSTPTPISLAVAESDKRSSDGGEDHALAAGQAASTTTKLSRKRHGSRAPTSPVGGGPGTGSPPVRLAAARRHSTAELIADAAAPIGRWLSEKVFWHVGLLYTCARLSINLTATYVPLLMLEVCERSVDEVASVPILMYVFQIIGAVAAKRVSSHVNKMRALPLFVVASAASSLGLWLLPSYAWSAILCAVCAQSLASSGVLVLVVAMQADAARLFPTFGHGFLFGTHSMFDKLSSGIAIVVLQHHAQRNAVENTDSSTGMAAPAGAAARSAFVIGACLVPFGGAVCAAILCLRDAIAPGTALAVRAGTIAVGDASPAANTAALERDAELEAGKDNAARVLRHSTGSSGDVLEANGVNKPLLPHSTRE